MSDELYEDIELLRRETRNLNRQIEISYYSGESTAELERKLKPKQEQLSKKQKERQQR